MTTKYIIEKTFKCKSYGTVGDVYESKDKADAICEALNKAKPSQMLHYKVKQITL